MLLCSGSLSSDWLIGLSLSCPTRDVFCSSQHSPAQQDLPLRTAPPVLQLQPSGDVERRLSDWWELILYVLYVIHKRSILTNERCCLDTNPSWFLAMGLNKCAVAFYHHIWMCENILYEYIQMCECVIKCLNTFNFWVCSCYRFAWHFVNKWKRFVQITSTVWVQKEDLHRGLHFYLFVGEKRFIQNSARCESQVYSFESNL